MNWVYWAIVGAALVHIAEEYWGGFLTWFPKMTGLRLTRARFVTVNALFVVLCILAAIAGPRLVVFSLSVAALIFINACIHMVGTVLFRRYSPGLVSALVLYIPLAVSAYARAAAAGLTIDAGISAFALGLFWHAVPFLIYFLNRGFTRDPAR